MLPPQGEILVVSTGKRIALELFTIPPPGAHQLGAQPRQRRLYTPHPSENAPRTYSDVQISQHNIALPGDASLATAICPHAEPAPIYVYALCDEPWRVTMFRLWPQRVRDALVRDFSDELDVDAFAAELEGELLDAGAPPGREPGATPRSRGLLERTTFRFHVEPRLGSWITPNVFTHKLVSAPTAPQDQPRMRVLPGCAHALLVGTDADDRALAPRLFNLWTFADMHEPPPRGARWPDDARRGAAAAHERVHELGGTAPPRRDGNAVAPLLSAECVDIRWTFWQSGLVAIAWDDWAGRVCMVSKASPSTLYVLDYAFVPRLGGLSWAFFLRHS
jgi:hypothetical protein